MLDTEVLHRTRRLATFLLGALLLGLAAPDRTSARDPTDADCDGIDDLEEERLAKSFLPILWYWDHESCPEPGVILYHVRPFVPGNPDGPLTITWSVEYYDDCGSNGHAGDIETFAVTIHPLAPPDDSPSGYGAYSMTTVAHWGATEDYEWGWLCEHWDTETYLPYKGDLGYTEGPRFFPFWEEVYIADDKHSTYLTDFDCDAGGGGDDTHRPDRAARGRPWPGRGGRRHGGRSSSTCHPRSAGRESRGSVSSGQHPSGSTASAWWTWNHRCTPSAPLASSPPFTAASETWPRPWSGRTG